MVDRPLPPARPGAAPTPIRLDPIRLDVAGAFESAAGRLDSGRSPGAHRVLLLIDGRSGSGKTSFTDRLTAGHPDAHVMHLDDVYPHWDGLADGVTRARRLVQQWVDGEQARYLPTQWLGMPPRESVIVRPDRPLIVEGVGALLCRPDANDVAVAGYFFAANAQIRRARALARDGDAFRPYWESWAAQEDELARAHPTWSSHADYLVTVE